MSISPIVLDFIELIYKVPENDIPPCVTTTVKLCGPTGVATSVSCNPSSNVFVL